MAFCVLPLLKVLVPNLLALLLLLVNSSSAIQTVTHTTTVSTTITKTTTKTATTAAATTYNFAPFCTAVSVPNVGTYSLFYRGGSFIEATDNPGNFGNRPAVTAAFPRAYSQCQAAQACANAAGAAGADENNVYFSFDLHFLRSKAKWECVYYFDTNTNDTYFNVLDYDAVITFGYNCPYF